MRAMFTPLRWSGAIPVRIFRVTGTDTAPTTRSRISATSLSSPSSAEPAAFLHTFFAGQPILISMMSAPSSALKRAASASCVGSLPTICTERIPSWLLRCLRSMVLRLWVRLRSEVNISATASPAPNSRQSSRNGRSVTPAMGATTTLFANVCGPMVRACEGLLDAGVDVTKSSGSVSQNGGPDSTLLPRPDEGFWLIFDHFICGLGRDGQTCG